MIRKLSNNSKICMFIFTFNNLLMMPLYFYLSKTLKVSILLGVF